jgi:Zn-dependent peptidase ImmA (M78 family)
VRPRANFIRKAAQELLARCGIKDPPVDLRRVCAKSGLCYEEVDYFPDDVDALIITLEDRVVAAVNANQSENRRRFSLAHELCHHLLHQDRSILEERITIDNPPSGAAEYYDKDPFEAEADIFAAELLVPYPMLKKSFKTGQTAAELACVFAVSESVVSIAIARHYSSLFR